MWEAAHQIYFLVLEGHLSELGLTDKVMSCLFDARVAGATWLRLSLLSPLSAEIPSP